MDNWKNVAFAGTSLLNDRQFSTFMRILDSLGFYESIFKVNFIIKILDMFMDD